MVMRLEASLGCVNITVRSLSRRACLISETERAQRHGKRRVQIAVGAGFCYTIDPSLHFSANHQEEIDNFQNMAIKFSPIVLVSILIVMLAVADYTSAASAAELRPQRRRRPSPADADLDGASMTSSPRRLNTKLTSSGRTSFNWDIEQSCLAEPGCEWSCQDSYECNCRCKFEDPQVANIRWPSGLSSRLWWN